MMELLMQDEGIAARILEKHLAASANFSSSLEKRKMFAIKR